MDFKINHTQICLKYNVNGKSSNALAGGIGSILTFHTFGQIGQKILVEGSNSPDTNHWVKIYEDTLTTVTSSTVLMMSWSHLRVTGNASLIVSRG